MVRARHVGRNTRNFVISAATPSRLVALPNGAVAKPPQHSNNGGGPLATSVSAHSDDAPDGSWKSINRLSCAGWRWSRRPPEKSATSEAAENAAAAPTPLWPLRKTMPTTPPAAIDPTTELKASSTPRIFSAIPLPKLQAAPTAAKMAEFLPTALRVCLIAAWGPCGVVSHAILMAPNKPPPTMP
jgi:hypothetical protein